MPARTAFHFTAFLSTTLGVFAFGLLGLSYVEYSISFGGRIGSEGVFGEGVHEHLQFTVAVGAIVVMMLQFWPHVYRGRCLLPLAASLLVFAGMCDPAMSSDRKTYVTLLVSTVALPLALVLRVLFQFCWYVRIIVALTVTYFVMFVPFNIQWYFKKELGFPTAPSLVVPGIVLLVLSLLITARPLFELGFECFTRIQYKIRARGPGVRAFPTRGPVVLIANHSSYLDPLFLAGDVPRPLTPMMTSKFYDRPFIYPLVRYVFGVIRVPDMVVKRSAPELDVAVQALDAGKCLVIFPEGFLQRKEDQVLRRFGRGVWEILKARPDTPVVAAWIEGGWGSYFSFAGGPPTKGKRPDLRRPITIGYSTPFTVPKELLEDHWDTRFFLMNQVGAARAHLGLPRIPEISMPAKEPDPHGDGADDS